MKPCALLLSLLLALASYPAWGEGEIVTGPDRRNEIDLRIAELDAERAAVSTRGPKVAVLVGLGTMALGVVPLMVGVTANSPYEYDYPRSAGGIITGSTLMGIGAVTAFAAGLVWGERINRRNEIDTERELLIEKRAGLAGALSRVELRSPYRNGAQFVTLGFRF